MKYIYCLIFCFLFPTSHATEQQITCQVVGISDGDTLTCLFNRSPIKVRLVHIDAPESSQPYGNKAKQALANLAFKQHIMLTSTGYDRYQRLLAEAYNYKGENLNLKLVQQGMAWAYTKTEPQYEQAQKQAQDAKLGLWRDSFPIPPSQWRKSHDISPQAVKNREDFATSSPIIDCQTKRSCQQIGSFALAQHYFQQCDWKELDGNNDGIPCNKLYRQEHKNRN